MKENWTKSDKLVIINLLIRSRDMLHIIKNLNLQHPSNDISSSLVYKGLVNNLNSVINEFGSDVACECSCHPYYAACACCIDKHNFAKGI